MLLWLQWLPPPKQCQHRQARQMVSSQMPPLHRRTMTIPRAWSQVLEQLQRLGFSESSSALDELSKKVEEAKARRAAAKPL